MTELELQILNSIKKKQSCLEIMKTYNLTNEQLWNILFNLKCQGFSILRKYYYSGELIYDFNKLVTEQPQNNEIIMGKNDNTFTAILIADTHFGGELESIDMLYRAYNLCAKFGVHIIIHCGDFVDSFVNGKAASIGNFMEHQAKQIDRAIKVYPFDPTIFNFICLGNHDKYALDKGNQNLALVFENRRHDLIPIGWNSGAINIKRDKILVGHKVNKKFFTEVEGNIIILGHKHHLSYEFNKGKIIINVPALNCIRNPILKLTLKLEKGVFISGFIEEYSASYGLYGINKSNEIKFDIESSGEARTRTL